MYQGGKGRISIDWGNNEYGDKTGELVAGDTVVSCVVEHTTEKPNGASNLTLGSITIPSNSNSDDIRGRVWSDGEATFCTVTAASNQTVGAYVLKFTATTAYGFNPIGMVRIYIKNAT